MRGPTQEKTILVSALAMLSVRRTGIQLVFIYIPKCCHLRHHHVDDFILIVQHLLVSADILFLQPPCYRVGNEKQ